MSDLNKARKAISMLLDHAVQDFEKDDKCIEAVEYALDVLRGMPNEDTIAAIMDSRSRKNIEHITEDFISRM